MSRYRFLARGLGLCTAALLVVTPLLLFGGGCGSDEETVERRKSPKQAASKKKAATDESGLPAALDDEQKEGSGSGKSREIVREELPFSYDPLGKRDPFKSFVVISPGTRTRSASETLTPLQRLDISQLALVGTIVGKGKDSALVEDASGKGYILSVGTYIGKNGGKVAGIEDGKILIEEYTIDYFGKKKSKMISMKLPRETEGED